MSATYDIFVKNLKYLSKAEAMDDLKRMTSELVKLKKQIHALGFPDLNEFLNDVRYSTFSTIKFDTIADNELDVIKSKWLDFHIAIDAHIACLIKILNDDYKN